MKKLLTSLLTVALIMSALLPSPAAATVGAPLSDQTLKPFWAAHDAYMNLLLRTEQAEADLLIEVDLQAYRVENYWRSVFERDLYTRLKSEGDNFNWSALEPRAKELSASVTDLSAFRREETARIGLRAGAAAIAAGVAAAGSEFSRRLPDLVATAEESLARRLSRAKEYGEYVALLGFPRQGPVSAADVDRQLRKAAPAAEPPAVQPQKMEELKPALADLHQQLSAAAAALADATSDLSAFTRTLEKSQEQGGLLRITYEAEIAGDQATIFAVGPKRQEFWTGRVILKGDEAYLPLAAFQALGYPLTYPRRSGYQRLELVTPDRTRVALLAAEDRLSSCLSDWDFCGLITTGTDGKREAFAPVSMVGARVVTAGDKTRVENLLTITALPASRSQIAAVAEANSVEIAGVAGDLDSEGLIPLRAASAGGGTWVDVAAHGLPTFWTGQGEFEKLGSLTAFWLHDGGMLLRSAAALPQAGILDGTFAAVYPEAVASRASAAQVLQVLAWAKGEALAFVRSHGSNAFPYGAAFSAAGIAYNPQNVAETLKSLDGQSRLLYLRLYSGRVAGNLLPYLLNGGIPGLIAGLLKNAPAGTVLDRETLKSWALAAIVKRAETGGTEEGRELARSIVEDPGSVAFLEYHFLGQTLRTYNYGFRRSDAQSVLVSRPVDAASSDQDTFILLDTSSLAQDVVQTALPTGWYVVKRDIEKGIYSDTSVLIIGVGPLGMAGPTATAGGRAIRLKVGSVAARVNGAARLMPAPPIIASDRTLVPLRWIGEALGAQIGWDGAEQKVTYVLGDRSVELWIGRDRARVNGAEVTLAVAPSLRDGSTYVPVRFISEALGANVSYDPTDQSILVTSP